MKKIYPFLLMLLLAAVSTQTALADIGGKIPGGTWSFDSASGVLTVSADSIPDYETTKYTKDSPLFPPAKLVPDGINANHPFHITSAPWGALANQATAIELKNVKKIGKNAFAGMYMVQTVIGPTYFDRLVVEDYAFYCCFSLSGMYFSSVCHLGNRAFAYTAVSQAIFEKLESYGETPFYGCWNMWHRQTENVTVVNFMPEPSVIIDTDTKPKGSGKFCGSRKDQHVFLTLVPYRQKDQWGKIDYSESEHFCPGFTSWTSSSSFFVQYYWYLRNSTEIVVNGMNYWRLEKEDFSNLLTNGKNEDIKTIRMIGVKGIEKETFNNFTKLEEVIIEDDALDKIGEGAFENCESLRSISSTRSVTELGNRAFYRCENLRYLDLSSCQTLGDRALAYTGLTSVRFVALKTIETKDADEFAGCSNLEHVYIYNTPPDTKGADPFAKSNASNLTIHTMPAYLSSYKKGVWAKYNVEAEYTLPVSGSGWKIDEKGVLTLTSMPEVAYGSAADVPWHNYRAMITAVKAATNVTINAVGDYWFSDMDKLERVDFQIIGRVGKYAFDGCTNLKHLLILSVTSVGDGAFSECESLDAIAFDASLKTLGQSVFYDCDHLREIWLKDSWTPPTVTAKTFQGLDQSKVTVHVPSADIADYVQADYWKPFKFTMEGNVVGYSDIVAAGTFYDSYFILQGDGTLSCFAQDHTKNASQTATALSPYKNKVSSIVIYGDITYLGLGAIFKDFSSLQKVKLPHNLVELNGTFEGCNNLTNIQLPSGLNRIGSNTFKSCVSLREINIVFVSEIGSYAFQGSGVEQIATLADIEQGAFQGCRNLKEVKLGSRVIPANLFNSCPALTTVHLNPSVRSFEDNAFKGTNLKDIYYFSPSPGVRNYSGVETQFSGFQASNITLHVPAFAVEVFRHYSPWKYMKIEGEDESMTRMGSLYNAEPQTWWLIGLNGELNIVPEEEGVAQMSEWQNANDYLYNQIDPWMPYISSVRILSDFVNTIDNLMPNDRYVLEGGVTSITLGANMQHVGKSFNQLYNLEHVYCRAHQVPEIDPEAFDWKVISDNSVTLHVLKSVGVNAYRANTYWKKFRIVADLADSYSVSVLTAEHGDIVCQENVDLNEVPAGTTLHFRAVPDDGYRLVRWHNYDENTGLTVNADCTIGAIFAPISDGIEDIEIDQLDNKGNAANRKVLIDGHIYIIRNGHIYNIHGMRVK